MGTLRGVVFWPKFLVKPIMSTNVSERGQATCVCVSPPPPHGLVLFVRESRQHADRPFASPPQFVQGLVRYRAKGVYSGEGNATSCYAVNGSHQNGGAANLLGVRVDLLRLLPE